MRCKVKRVINGIKARIFIGILTLLPLMIALYVIKAIYTIFYNITYPIMDVFRIQREGIHIAITLMVFFIVCIIIFIVGFSLKTRIGTESLGFFEEIILKKIPGYTMLKETIEQFKHSDDKQSPFSKVALVDLYESNVLMSAFITDETEKHYTVYVPVAPNITSGYIHHVEKKYVYPLTKCDASEMIKSLVNCGIGSSKILQEGS